MLLILFLIQMSPRNGLMTNLSWSTLLSCTMFCHISTKYGWCDFIDLSGSLTLGKRMAQELQLAVQGRENVVGL